MKFLNKNKGITLIALVITIIVLLILAGISINMLTGENGILKRASEAKEKTEIAQQNEEDTLNDYETKLNEYAGIDWDTALANATMHPDQTTSTAIGVGTDGKPVNMDLWEYTLLDDGTYGLNDSDTYNCIEYGGTLDNNVRGKGYKGTYTSDGKIEGTLPTYISNDGGKTYIEVTDMYCTFKGDESLIIAPQIPNTVTNIWNIFNSCSNLVEIVGELPNGITNMQSAFKGCISLKEAPKIPDSVIDMSSTFYNCSAMTAGPSIIGDGVTNMAYTFCNCSAMVTGPFKIGDSVIDMTSTFYNCSAMITGPSEIGDSVIDMTLTFYNCSAMVTGPSKIGNNVMNMSSTFEGCSSMITGLVNIPSSVVNMKRTFKNCYKLEGTIEINANVTGSLINGEIDYLNTFYDTGMNGTGITILKSSICSTDILIAMADQSSKVNLEE